MSGRCAVCGGELGPHLSVAGSAGPEGLLPTTDRYGTALSNIARCEVCGHMQLDPMPARAVLDGMLREAFSADLLAEAEGQRRTARVVLGHLRARLPPGGSAPPRLLDLGCWLGLELDEAQRAGWVATGVEPSQGASALARERFGLDVRTAGILDADLPEAGFDAVLMHDVIEHLPDPRMALRRVARWTVPGGLLHLALPDAGSAVARRLGRRWWSVIPTHVQYFTRSSLARLLAGSGYEVLEVGTAPKAFSVEYYLGRLHGYFPPAARLAIAAARRAGVAERIWAPDFRDRMSVLARAPGDARESR